MRLSARGFDDLTASNPTDAGFDYPADLLAPLGSADALRYDPKPFGLPAAREAVAADYARRGIKVPASHVALTASSSESYALLFKLLCDPGDSVLVPTPSYPLFEHLTRLDSVQRAAVRHAVPRHVGDRSRGPEGRDHRHHAGDSRREPEQPHGRVAEARRVVGVDGALRDARPRADRRRGLRRLPDRSGPRARRRASSSRATCSRSVSAACRSRSACRR